MYGGWSYDEDDQDFDGFQPKENQILIAIDTHSTMFVQDNQGLMPFKNCLKACYDMLDGLVVHCKKKTVSIMFIDNEESDNKFISFNMSMSDSVPKLKEIVTRDNAELERKFKCDDVDYASFFMNSKKIFALSKMASANKILVLFTNNEDPSDGDNTKRFKVLQEAETFSAVDISVQVVAMSEYFNYDTFYEEFFKTLEHKAMYECCIDPDGVLDKLLENVRAKAHHRRMKFFISKNNPNIFINVHIKNCFKNIKILRNTMVTKDTNQEVVWKKRTANTTQHNYPKKGITLDHDEYLLYARTFNDPVGFRLICVTKRLTKIGVMCSPQKVMIANPEESSERFDIFWQYCVDNEKVLLCGCRYSVAFRPKLVELIPKFVYNRRCFMVNTVYQQRRHKYVTDEFDQPLHITSEERKIAKDFINRLTFDYDPTLFPNPVYTKKEAYIKAELMGGDMNDYITVKQMDYKNDIDGKIQDLAEDFERLFCPKPVKKRGRGQRGEPSKKKK